MKFLRLLVDNSTLILGAVTALFGLLSAFGLHLTSEQVGAVMTFLGAIIAIGGALLTVAKRQVVTTVDSGGVIRAGPAAATQTGTPADVTRDPSSGDLVSQVPVRQDLLEAA